MKQTDQRDKIDVKRMLNLPIIDPKNPSRKLDEKEEKFKKELRTYEFYNLEEPGLMHKFSYGNTKNRYDFTFFHGGKYKVPRFIADHVGSASTPIWKWRPDGTGTMRKELTGQKSRFQMREIYEGA